MIEAGHYAKKQILCKNKLIAWSHISRFKTTRKLLEKYANNRSKLLDYGCGDGTFITMVSDIFPEAIGTDIAPEQITDCQERCLSLQPQISFSFINEIESEQYGSYFDVAVCMEVLEHCVPEDVEKVLGTLKRVVKPKGIIIISVPIEIGPSLILKQITRTVAGWLKQGDYATSVEPYTMGEFFRMVFATKSTSIERPIAVHNSALSYGHKGFNWRALRYELANQFNIEHTVFSPLGWLGGFVSSQVFLVCHNK